MTQQAADRGPGEVPGNVPVIIAWALSDYYWTMEEKHTFKKRLCHNDFRRFKKYVESTTTHGVVHVFSGRSIIRRVFWAVIFLGAMVGCLYNIIDRIRYLAGQPTATTISIKREASLAFPSITVCNLNLARRSYLEANGLDEFVSSAFQAPVTDANGFSSMCQSDALPLIPALRNVSSGRSGMRLGQNAIFHTVQFEGRHFLEDFVVECYFRGRRCNITEDFEPVLTQLGYCYTFNSGRNERPALFANGTGPRQGLQLLLNIQQSEYIASPNGDAGVKIAVHPQGEPGEPSNDGVAVPPGRNAFLALRERRVMDRSSGRRDTCRESNDKEGFNFLQEEYNYSTTACLIDCFFTSITQRCRCIEAYQPISNTLRSLPDCSVSEICCVIDEYATAKTCDCPTACEYTVYDVSTSYSIFPSERFGKNFSQERNLTLLQVSNNYLVVEIYFESLNVEREVTEDAYSVVALLSDIGGQLALFIGASFISILELAMWLLDEIKDRCCGISEEKIHDWVEAEKRKFEEWEENKHRESEMKTLPKLKETNV